jgi:F0F1-type ATP synthase assembly protein I
VTDRLGDFLFYLIFIVAGAGAGPALVIRGPLVVGQTLLARRLLMEEVMGATDSMEAVTHLLLWPTAVLLAGQWLLFPAVAAGAAGYDAMYGLVSLVVPTLYFVPLTITRQRETSLQLAFVTGLLISPIPVVVTLAPHTAANPVIGSLALRYVPWGLVVAAMGIFAYVAGYRVAATEREHTSRLRALRRSAGLGRNSQI